MKTRVLSAWPILLLITFLSAFALWGVAAVPFHPDESTQLFTSADFEALLSDPLSMAWAPGGDREQGSSGEGNRRQLYRTLDAPLTRYLLGLGRSIAGKPALPVDWDWTQSWQENQEAGALPDPGLLRTSRITITLLLPLSLFFIYQIGKEISGPSTGLLAALMLGGNALVLLHTRRAMAEGALVCGLILALWCFLRGDKRPWLAGLGMALAFNAKQTLLALLPVGWLAVCWPAPSKPLRPAKLAQASLAYLGIFVLVTFLLNPFLWRDPLGAAQAALHNRQRLLEQQQADVGSQAPEQILETPAKRAAVLLANLYLAPLSYAEAQNYSTQTAAAEETYQSMPGHNLLRNLAGGAFLLILAFLGVIFAARRLPKMEPQKRRGVILLLAASLFQALLLIATISLPWQRYVMPLAPLACLWQAYAIGIYFDNKITEGDPG